MQSKEGLKMRLIVLLVVLGAVLSSSIVRADQNDERLAELFTKLRGTAEPALLANVERRIWTIWSASGREDVDKVLLHGARSMATGDFSAAIEHFGQVIEMAPTFAEGWNKRATAYYLADQLDASVRDIQQTLSLEPRHFGALSGMGLIFLERGDLAGALMAFEQVLRVHPNSPNARHRVRELRARLGRGAA
jgi:tetratricopeptide (TPR) repeat protein